MTELKEYASSRRKKSIYKLAVKWFNVRVKVISWLGSFSRRIGFYAGTVIGLLATFFLYTPHAQNILARCEDFSQAFLAIGAIIGTMLALVLSLSIIPVQRATEVFTPLIVRLYRSDGVTLLLFSILTLFCLTSIVLGFDGIVGVGVVRLFPLEVLFLAISLDLLRWHHRRVSVLLTPSFALSRLLKLSTDYISKFQRQVVKLSRIHFRILPEEEIKEHTHELMQTEIYRHHQYHIDLLKHYMDEIAEIVSKAVDRGETTTAKSGINALIVISQSYLSSRKGNLIIFPSQQALMATESDVDPVLNAAYEHLQDIFQQAATSQNETVCIQIIRGLESMATFTANLKARVFRDSSAPLTFAPIYRMKLACQLAQQKDLLDTPLQASGSMLRIGVSAPDNVDLSSVHIPLIENWFVIAQGYYLSRKTPLVNNVLTDMLMLLHHLIKKDHFQYEYVLRQVLEKLKMLVPLALASEVLEGNPLADSTLAPYATTNPYSFHNLVRFATSTIKKDQDKPRINPYHNFMRINKILYRHFRDLAENVDFGRSFFLWEIITSIRYVAQIYVALIEESVTDDRSHIENLAKQLPWYMAFFCVVFSKAKQFNANHAEEACDVMAWIALSVYDKDGFDNLKTCVENISAIIGYYSKPEHYASQNYGCYTMADMFMFLWRIRIYAESRNDRHIIEDIDKRFSEKPDGLSDEHWAEVLEAIELRKGQMQEELSEIDMLAMRRLRNDSMSLLKTLLEENKT